MCSFSANKIYNGPATWSILASHYAWGPPQLHKTAFPTPMVRPLDESQGSSPLQGGGSWLMWEVVLWRREKGAARKNQPAPARADSVARGFGSATHTQRSREAGGRIWREQRLQSLNSEAMCELFRILARGLLAHPQPYYRGASLGPAAHSEINENFGSSSTCLCLLSV